MRRWLWNMLARHLAGETTPEESRRLSAHLAASARDRRLLADLRRIWDADPETWDTDSGWRRIQSRLSARERRLRMIRTWLPAAAAAVVIALTPLLLRRAGGVDTEPVRAVALFATGPAELTTVRLRDGSVARLAPSSRLRVNEGAGDREVWLEGRAYFAVERRPEAPFTVHTRAGQVRVLGTRFVMDAHSDSVQVAVLEGAVALQAGGGEVEVSAGRASTGHFGSPPSAAVEADVLGISDWIGPVLIFHDTPLAVATRELERRFDTRIVVEDPVLDSRTLTAVFDGEGLEEVIGTICRVVAARCTHEDGVVRMTR